MIAAGGAEIAFKRATCLFKVTDISVSLNAFKENITAIKRM